MTMLNPAIPPPFAGITALHLEGQRRHPLLWGTALFFAFLILPTLAAYLIEARTLYGVNVWMKPLKFEVSLALYFGTLAWFAGYFAEGRWQSRTVRWFTVVAVAAALFEQGYMMFQAARGRASHFNDATIFESVMFALMGLGAVALSMLSLVYAVVLARGARPDLAPAFRLSVILGLALTFVLGVGAGVAISLNDSHWVGVAPSDAGGIPIFGWSREGGDLRVAHFFGIHAMQTIPFVGWIVARRNPGATFVVWFAAAVLTAVTAFTLAQALAGRPLLPSL